MAYSYEITLLILCPLMFLAAFIDSIAGGGGLISIPAYIFAGLPIHTAVGTNKFSTSFGTATAMINYIRSGSVDFRAAISGALFALLGSWIGTRLALSLSPKVLQICLMIVLPLVGICIFSNRGIEKSQLKEPLPIKLKMLLSCAIGLVLGGYDGFFGPGAGMFITLALSGLVRLELVKAVGTTKLISFSAQLVSVITWLVNGKVLFAVAIPCTIFAIAGNYVGSRLAIKVGKKLIRSVLAIVSILLFIKILTDLIMTR